MRLNVGRKGVHGFTHEGAAAAPMTVEQALRRSVMSCLLWESEFYENGQEIGARILKLAHEVEPSTLADMAREARSKANLRHVPLLLLAALAGHPRRTRSVTAAIVDVVQRADELTEFVAIYAKVNGVLPKNVKAKLSPGVKRGLARAFRKFDEYQLAKYFSQVGEKGAAVKARDVMRMVHPKPKDDAQAELWKRAIAYELPAPDTWEVALTRGGDKREVFERLLGENKLGYLALLRNLRNMAEANVNPDLIQHAILVRKGAHRVLPFRYVAAARAAPQFERVLDSALLAALGESAPLPGKTVVLVDVSGSMAHNLSGKSDLRRVDAAATLASIIKGDVRLFTFSDRTEELAHRLGMAGVDNIAKTHFQGGGTMLGDAIVRVNRVKADRLIVVTDEQSHQNISEPQFERAYMINVASARHGVGYGPWVHIDGFSENVLRFIQECEQGENDA